MYFYRLTSLFLLMTNMLPEVDSSCYNSPCNQFSHLIVNSIKSMKYIIPLMLICLLYSCKKEKAVVYANDGVITGIDMRQCPCLLECPCACGGLIFHFTNTSDTSRIIIDNARIFKLTNNPQFPVRIKINWQNTTRCNARAIKVTSYALF